MVASFTLLVADRHADGILIASSRSPFAPHTQQLVGYLHLVQASGPHRPWQHPRPWQREGIARTVGNNRNEETAISVPIIAVAVQRSPPLTGALI